MSNPANTLKTATSLHQQGKFEDAKKLYQASLNQDPNQPEALQLLGVLCHQTQEERQAIDYLLASLKLSPNNPQIQQTFITVLLQQGQVQKALSWVEQWMAAAEAEDKIYQKDRDPAGDIENGNQRNTPESTILSRLSQWEALAGIFLVHHYPEPAVLLYQQILKQSENALAENTLAKRGSGSLYHNLGIAHMDAGSPFAALPFLLKASQISPQNLNTLNTLGNCYQLTHHAQAAIECYQQAIDMNHQQPDAFYHLGMAYQKNGQDLEAEKAYQTVLSLDPGWMEAYLNLGALFHLQEKPDAAEAYYLRALHLEPNHWQTLENLGNLMAEQGKQAEAQTYFKQALDVTENNPHLSPLQRRLWQFRADTVCPVIPESTDEIRQYRQKLLVSLEKLLVDLKSWKETSHLGSFTLDDLLKAGCDPSFYLGYQGEEDLAFRRHFASIFKQLLKLLQPLALESFNLPQHQTLSAPNSLTKIPGFSRIPRIGILVTDSHEGIFMKLMGGLLQCLDPNQLDIHIIGSLSGIEKIKNRFHAYPNLPPTHYLPLFSQGSLAVEQIKNAQFDMIFYFEVGTDALNYILPFLKLAPVQVTSWGVPITTGNPEMDYVITSSLIEAENASKHYTESLVLMPQLPIAFSKPQFEWISKAEFTDKFQIPQGFVLFSCPQNLFKLHPDFDITLARILGQAHEALLLMIEGRSPHWNVNFKKRLKKSFETAGFSQAWERVIFLPRLNHDAFLSFLAHSDVILDPFYYSGGTTSLEALSLGTPIITLPGATAKGRLTLGCYKAMDIMDCVVDTPKAYEDLALRLFSDKDFQSNIREKIQLNNNKLLNNAEAIKGFQNTLIQLASQALPPSFD